MENNSLYQHDKATTKVDNEIDSRFILSRLIDIDLV